MQTWTFDEHPTYDDGPWVDEPDKAQWVDETTGLDCLVVRNGLDAWCGYVGVPPGHPLHGKDYGDLDIDAHGGLTYAAPCQEDDGKVCHVPEPGRPADVWWFGFDCAHSPMDYIPRMDRDFHFPEILRGTYKDFEYVRAETTHLAAQLA